MVLYFLAGKVRIFSFHLVIFSDPVLLGIKKGAIFFRALLESSNLKFNYLYLKTLISVISSSGFIT